MPLTQSVWPSALREAPARIGAAERLDGAPVFPGLTIELEEIWAG